MEKTYLFYDLETSGLNKCFDQVLQFAAIRTTLDLKEIERHQIFVRLSQDTVPSPEAFLAHRISIDKLQKGVSEYEAILKIHVLLNEPGTISVGYNTLGFDDEFLRFSFFRHLLDPYSHQYAHGCGRMDLFPITIWYFLYQKQAINWPEKEGKPTLKLEYLNEANHYVKGQAHDAMVDVEVTVELARALSQYKEIWHYALGYFDKYEEEKRAAHQLSMFENGKEALAILGKFGAEQHFQSIVLHLGQHYHYKNQSIWLRLDQAELSEINLDNFKEKTWVIRKKSGEPPFLLPVKERLVRLNEKTLAIVEKNKHFLKNNSVLLKIVAAYYCDFKYPDIENLDANAALYQEAFLSDQEKALCKQFNQVPFEQKIKLLPQFSRPTLKTQAIRLLGRYYFDQLPDTYQAEFSNYLDELNQQNFAFDYCGQSRMTPKESLEGIRRIKKEKALNKEQLDILSGLENYIKRMFNQVCS